MNQKKIRIVFGVNDFLVGGMQRQFIEQLRFFNAERYEISLVTLFDFPGQSDLYADLPTSLEVHKLAFKSVRDVRSWVALYRLLKECKPDIVVSSLFFSNMVFRVLKPFLGYVVIPCEHNTYTGKRFFERCVDQLLAGISYRIIAVSSTVASFTARQEHIPISKFEIIQNGIDVRAWQEDIQVLPTKEVIREELGLPKHAQVLLTVARLMPQKNHALLLESFAQVYAVHHDVVLVIVGDGPLRKKLGAKAKELGIEEAVYFFGVRSDVAKFYKASDVFVLTSDIEGFALVCIEAMSAGLPVVSTTTAGPDEYIQDSINGYLVEHAALQIAEGIEKVFKAGTQKFVDGALATACTYDIKTSVRKYEALFERAVGSPGRSVAIVTFANLGKKKNLKTIDIEPVLEMFVAKGTLVQVLCQINADSEIEQVESALPLLVRYGIGLLRRIPGGELSRQQVEQIFDFFAAHNLRRADVVLLHGAYFLHNTIAKAKKIGAVTIDLAVSADVRTNVHIEQEEMDRLGYPGYAGVYTRLARIASRRNTECEYGIVMSEFAKDTYIENGFPADRLYVATPDIDIQRFVPASSEQHAFVALYVAHTQPIKGLHYLLQAWQAFSPRDAQLTILGGFSDMPEELEKQYRDIISSDERISWVINTNEPEAYYHKASVLVFPSLTEGFGRVTLEAMACGIPVITTVNARGIVEDGKTGFVIPIRDAGAIREKLEYLYNNQDVARKMGGDARVAVEQKKSFGEAVYEICQNILIKDKI